MFPFVLAKCAGGDLEELRREFSLQDNLEGVVFVQRQAHAALQAFLDSEVLLPGADELVLRVDRPCQREGEG